MKRFIPLIAFILIAFSAKTDGVLISWGPADMAGMTKERFDASKKWSTSEILEKIKTATEWPEIYLCLIASKQYQKDSVFIDSLINQIINSNEIKISLTSRLIIWERIITDDMLFEGKGIQINDDLYKISGRANWILRNITGKDFGRIKINYTKDSLSLLRSKWIDWKNGKPIEGYKDPYETIEKGLSEIRSKEALQAIIYSLKPSSEKDKLTSNCLMKLYGLTELPKDPDALGYLCSPDSYSNDYLRTLTGVEKNNSFEWWNNWWIKNADKLSWNKDTGKFDLKK